jgi:serine phosphatase RsbU (regulator of sigma subunit)
MGGDLYDIIPLDDHRTALVVLDVAGHGISAALISVMAKLSFDRHVRIGLGPHEILQHVNNEIVRYMPLDRFVTAFLGIIDTTAKEFTFSRAGNPAALLCRMQTRLCESLSTGGTFVGMFPEVHFEQKTVSVNRGDKLVLYTDGLIECVNEKGERFGKARLEKCVLDSLDSDADETTARIIREVHAQTPAQPQTDDITLVVLTVL